MKVTRGITPAHAGNTLYSLLHMLIDWDHPRTRGEYIVVSAFPPPAVGSPPHTRGILSCRHVLHILTRITPAHAGNTFSMKTCLAFCRDHPRTRGEYERSRLLTGHIPGSPPHTRGILKSWFVQNVYCGITPAHAGNT